MKYTIQEKYDMALKAYHNAYCPYSKFRVGAIAILKNGQCFNGANVENASYGLTNCAERTALFSVYANGFTKDDIEELVIIADSPKGFTSPCGACRQVISELMMPNKTVTLMKLDGKWISYKVSDLLPFAFSNEDLNE